MSASPVEDGVGFAFVGNIPASYHSKDLRVFFSAFVEADRLDCFHFLHRRQCDGASPRVNCCYVSMASKELQAFICHYNSKLWYDYEGNIHWSKCLAYAADDQEVGASSNLVLKELNPPKLMPKGNVGTPTSHFFQAVKTCQLPSKVISNLGLTFAKRSKGKYNQISYKYGGWKCEQSKLVNGVGANANDEEAVDVDECEEWERHEAFHEDCGKQERLNERLYEKDMEVVWEKGGPGLVFYTDAFYRDQQDADTDSRWADEWDLDMSVYYKRPGDYNVGDKDAQDMIAIRQSELSALAMCSGSVFEKAQVPKKSKTKTKSKLTNSQDSSQMAFASFEKYTKGVGSRILAKHGWKMGEALGKGRVEPIVFELAASSQTPFQKKGFGYRGKKLKRYGLQRQPEQHSIATIYDQVVQIHHETLLRRSDTTYMKSRAQ